jgi:hypothetical protein
MLVDEARLPDGYDRLDDLPCQHATAPEESSS